MNKLERFSHYFGVALGWCFVLLIIAAACFSAWAVLFALFQINKWLGMVAAGAFGFVIAIDLIYLIVFRYVLKH